MKAVYLRELRSYFTTVIGYLFIAAMTLLVGIYAYVLNFDQKYPTFEQTLYYIDFVYLLVIPILTMDEEFTVVADTTAMGDPVEIEYHLTFYSNTIDDKDAIPQEAAIKVLWIALIVIVAGGILNYVLKKRKKR